MSTRSRLATVLLLLVSCACAAPRPILRRTASEVDESEARASLEACRVSARESLDTTWSRLRQGGLLAVGALVGGACGLTTLWVPDDEEPGTALAVSAATGAVIGAIGGLWVLARERRDDYRAGIRSCMREHSFEIIGWE